MRRPRPLPPELRDVPFTTADARAAGVEPARLRAQDLTAPFHGVRVTVPAANLEARARAFAVKLLPGQYFSHTTAAVLLGMRMPEGFVARELHVTSTAPKRAVRAAGVHDHQAEKPAAVRMMNGLPVSPPVETWCQLASVFSLEDLIAAGDGLVCRVRPESTPRELHKAAAEFQGRGARKLREAACHVRPGTDSHRETRLRRLVITAGFPEPEVNGVILNSHGVEIARGDLVFRKYRTILEYEGAQHWESDRQFAIDIDRLDSIMEERWRVIRVDKFLIARRATLVGKIDKALREGGWRPDLTSN